MSEEIPFQLEFEILESDIRRAQRRLVFRPRKSLHSTWFYLIIWLTFPLIYLVLVVFSGLRFLLPIFLLTLAPTLWGVVTIVGAEYQLRHYLKNRPLIDGRHQFRFSTEGFQASGQLWGGRLNWEAFRDAIETKEDFLLFVSDAEFVLIPKRAIADTEIEERFKRLLVAHIPKVELISTGKVY